MYFFKNTAGNWVLGSETTSFTSKVPCTLRRDTPTVVTVMTIEKIPVLLIDKTEVTTIKKNAEGDFYANYADFVAAVSDFFDNAPITAEEVDAKIGAEVDILSDRIDTVEGIANAASAGYLGSIKPTDAAPTPARNGNYTFSIGGAKPAWLTAEAGVTEVKAGDGVAVVYTEPSTYSYTHVDTGYSIEQARSQSASKVPSSKLLDDELNNKADKSLIYNKTYADLNFASGYISNTTGLFTEMSGYKASDFIRVYNDDLIEVASNLAIGTAACYVTCYDINKAFIIASNTLRTVDFDGYVRLNCDGTNYTETSFAIIRNKIYKLDIDNANLNAKLNSSILIQFYATLPNLGYISKSNGAYISGFNHLSSDYIQVTTGDSITILNSVTVGYLATKIACYNSSKVFIKAVSILEIVDFDGYVRFCCEDVSFTSTSFWASLATLPSLKNRISKAESDITIINNTITSVIPNTTNALMTELGAWELFYGTSLVWDNTYKAAKLITDVGLYRGMKLNVNLDYEQYIAEFECKIIGNQRPWFLTQTDLGTNNTKFYPEKTWKRFKIIINAATATNKNFLFYQDYSEVNTFLVRDFRYSKLNTEQHSTFNKDIENRDKKATKAINDSVMSEIIDVQLSDFNNPLWAGNSDIKTADLIPSINTQGKSYLFNNDGTVELRVVKDAHSIFGIALSQKYVKSIIPKTRSIVFFGDSITYGVGTSAGYSYPEQTRDLLIADGHTISKFTNNGQSGADAGQLYDNFKTATPNAHDCAFLMVGMNDPEHWLNNNSLPNENGDIDSAGFRAKYRMDLSNLVDAISTYCSFSKLFLIVPTPQRNIAPDFPSVTRVNAIPLFDIITQEIILYAKGKSNICICRGDYYLSNPTNTDIGDGIHPTTTGAAKLAKGVRDEATYLM